MEVGHMIKHLNIKRMSRPCNWSKQGTFIDVHTMYSVHTCTTVLHPQGAKSCPLCSTGCQFFVTSQESVVHLLCISYLKIAASFYQILSYNPICKPSQVEWNGRSWSWSGWTSRSGCCSGNSGLRAFSFLPLAFLVSLVTIIIIMLLFAQLDDLCHWYLGDWDEWLFSKISMDSDF